MSEQETLVQAAHVLDILTPPFLMLKDPAAAVAVAMTLLDTYIEANEGSEQKTMELLDQALKARDEIIKLSGPIFQKKEEGVN